jgi:hypothetical protein
MFENDDISQQDLINAISRSGYLLESEVSHALSKAGFFVETNQTILDPLTGKSREIDILAEYWEYDKNRSEYNVCSKVNFVFEVKNNIFPLVLMTKLEYSPHTDLWGTVKEGRSAPDDFEVYDIEGFYEQLIENSDLNIFTQYCSFSRKSRNQELMASHPEALYSGFTKIVQYCDEMLENFKTWDSDKYHRFFLWQPILLVKDSLFEMTVDKDKSPVLKEVESTNLVFNYHRNQEPSSALIHLVTRKGLKNFLVNMLDIEKNIEDRVIAKLQNV